MALKSSAALEVLNLLQVYFQNSLWCWWIMQFDRRQRDEKGSVLVAGLVVLFAISAIPMPFLIIGAIQTSHGLSSTLWLGLGCTVAALLTGGAMIYVTIYHGFQLFHSRPSRKVEAYGLSALLSISGLAATITAVVVAGLNHLEVGLPLASLGLSCIQFVCSWGAEGRDAGIRRGFTSAILLAQVLTLLVRYMVAVYRNDLITGSDGASTALWVLSQCGFWLQGLVSFETPLDILDRYGFGRMILDFQMLPSDSGDAQQLTTAAHPTPTIEPGPSPYPQTSSEYINSSTGVGPSSNSIGMNPHSKSDFSSFDAYVLTPTPAGRLPQPSNTAMNLPKHMGGIRLQNTRYSPGTAYSTSPSSPQQPLKNSATQAVNSSHLACVRMHSGDSGMPQQLAESSISPTFLLGNSVRNHGSYI